MLAFVDKNGNYCTFHSLLIYFFLNRMGLFCSVVSSALWICTAAEGMAWHATEIQRELVELTTFTSYLFCVSARPVFLYIFASKQVNKSPASSEQKAESQQREQGHN